MSDEPDLQQLIANIKGDHNEVALQAIQEIRAHGWLADGSLHNIDLTGAHLWGADMSGAALKGADLLGANMQEVNLTGANLQSCQLIECNLVSADLSGANLKFALFHEANLQGAQLTGANLEGANFWTAILRETSFVSANLTGADLNQAILFRANLNGATLTRALLPGANLQDARFLSVEQLVRASMLRGAIMPDGQPYDGRFNLKDDIEWANRESYVIDDTSAMASFYGVTEEEYHAGQQWASKHLHEN